MLPDMSYFNWYEEHAMYCLLAALAFILIYLLWFLIFVVNGLKILWKWLDPPPEMTTKDYKSLFVDRATIEEEKVQVSISREMYEKMENYLAVISKETDVSAYVDSIVFYHLVKYKSEINKLYNNNFKEPL